MHLGHQFVVSLARLRIEKGRSIDIGEADPALAIPTFEQVDFAQAEWATPVEKDFNRKRLRKFLIYCGLHFPTQIVAYSRRTMTLPHLNRNVISQLTGSFAVQN